MTKSFTLILDSLARDVFASSRYLSIWSTCMITDKKQQREHGMNTGTHAQGMHGKIEAFGSSLH